MSALLSVSNLSKTYKVRRFWLKPKLITALDPVSFELQPYKTLAVVGEMGSGKSTLAKLLVGAEQPTTGHIKLNGQLLESKNFRQRCQHVRMIFQDSGTTLKPQLNHWSAA